MRRATLDIVSQSSSVAVSMLDRILLTGLLVRLWGIPGFERWTTIAAGVALLAVFDLGCQMNFGNRIANENHAGRRDISVRVYGESNAIFVGLGLLAIAFAVAICLHADLRSAIGLRHLDAWDDRIIIFNLGAATALKLALTNLSSVYRANLRFARGTVIASSAELIRIVAILATAGTGLGLETASFAVLAATVAGYALLMPIDIARLFPDYRYRIARPTRLTTRKMVQTSGLYAVPMIPNIILVNVPVIILGASSQAQAGLLAGFVLLRTFTNFLRMLIQKVIFVVGMELASLHARDRHTDLAALYPILSNFIAACLGYALGLVTVYGGEVFQLWVGSRALYDPLMLAIMAAPLILTPSALVANAFLQYANKPLFSALGAALQLGLAILIGWLAPIENLALRMTVAVYVAELVGFSIPVIYAASMELRGPQLVKTLSSTMISLALFAAIVMTGTTLNAAFTGGAGLYLSFAITALLFAAIPALLLKPALRYRPAS